MKLPVRLEHKIRLCIDALEEMVTVKGYDLTNPDVVKKSKELDRLIIRAMHLQRENRKHREEPVNT
ncbi:Spo0E family sporulation regulatory protein-aspartic acid phosphatase [Paenibacillus sp. NPDC056579]|uniref:Spo0E family sporulation regulatory protein-aspartic acid phosphatase n=1 Tax=unclassified Paenibacillus TaxID=185978 RepID=UPI001EF8812A|nr:Spo0E family sporulation regulatory protein-aspartic acid phosphatase [Paenibacillus sp. H1-7]ULL15763.1 aspartyl-phosphate phosphatase Spo0E family protein [Paenibacillus sp. H1-7]